MGINTNVRPRKAQLGPIQCYTEGKDFLGSQYGLFLGICLVGLLIGGIVPVVLYGPAFCGISYCFLKRTRGERVLFEDLFKGFDYFVPGLIATLIYVGCVTVLVIPFMFLIFALVALMSTNSAIISLIAGLLLFCAYVAWILIIGIASMLFTFATLLIVDKDMEGPAAMKLTFDAFLLNAWGVIATALVGQLMVFIGTLMCIVPGLLLIPLWLAGHFVAYHKIFGVELNKPIVAQAVYR